MQPRQEGPDQQTVRIGGPGLAADLLAEMQGEPLEVLAVGLDRVGRGVPLPVEVAQEGRNGLFQTAS